MISTRRRSPYPSPYPRKQVEWTGPDGDVGEGVSVCLLTAVYVSVSPPSSGGGGGHGVRRDVMRREGIIPTSQTHARTHTSAHTHTHTSAHKRTRTHTHREEEKPHAGAMDDT